MLAAMATLVFCAPGYPGAAGAFRAAGADVVGVRLDDQGMQRLKGGPSPRLIFTTPSHQHPTGRLMLAGSAVWMTMGIMVMRKMINFDF